MAKKKKRRRKKKERRRKKKEEKQKNKTEDRRQKDRGVINANIRTTRMDYLSSNFPIFPILSFCFFILCCRQIYSSDEGRVQVTAAAFARGLLELDNDIPPILASLVRKGDAVNNLLDDVTSAKPMVEPRKQWSNRNERKDRG